MATRIHLDIGAGVTACGRGATGRAVREHERCSAIALVSCGACRKADARELVSLVKADAKAAATKATAHATKAHADPYAFKADAHAWLTARWHEQADLDPALRGWLPVERYVAANLRACVRNMRRKADANAAEVTL